MESENRWDGGPFAETRRNREVEFGRVNVGEFVETQCGLMAEDSDG
jgi:hypothetical protein